MPFAVPFSLCQFGPAVSERVHISIHFTNIGYYSVESHQDEGYAQDSEMDPFMTWRPRRALPREYFIEIMVVADAKMVAYHGSGLVSYVLVLMSTVGTYKVILFVFKTLGYTGCSHIEIS